MGSVGRLNSYALQDPLWKIPAREEAQQFG